MARVEGIETIYCVSEKKIAGAVSLVCLRIPGVQRTEPGFGCSKACAVL